MYCYLIHIIIKLLCKSALNRIVNYYHINDYTLQITYMFGILDVFDPNNTERIYLKSHILHL